MKISFAPLRRHWVSVALVAVFLQTVFISPAYAGHYRVTLYLNQTMTTKELDASGQVFASSIQQWYPQAINGINDDDPGFIPKGGGGKGLVAVANPLETHYFQLIGTARARLT